MRRFVVNVNGKAYDVEIEEVAAGAAAPVAQPKPVVAPVAQPAPAPVAAPVAQPAPAPVAAPAGGTEVKAPMPGLILNLAVANGAAVKKGDKILVLEAMKMENDIVANADGVVTFTVKKGDNVESGATLAVIA